MIFWIEAISNANQNVNLIKKQVWITLTGMIAYWIVLIDEKKWNIYVHTYILY